MPSAMKYWPVLCALLAAAPLHAAEDVDFDPNAISEIDAINCHIDAPTYNGFAMAIGGEDSIAEKRGWKKVESGNVFMNEYELREPILVTGTHSTRRIGFTANAIIAILDMPDPAVIAREEEVENALDPEPLIAELVASGRATRAQVEAEIKFRKFMGERVIVDVVEQPEEGASFGVHTKIARTISNVTTHPGKTLYGCSYSIELLDKNGQPL
ncbi:MAG: hypothetical protein I8H86_06550 [Sphingomonadaceae bacterium]|nr:hypothetical protein [Sphingomonadaceae bacterium]